MDATVSTAQQMQWPPNWNTSPHGISTGRYIDPAFARLEHKRLWSRVWQMAARLDEIPQAGDYTTYDIGDQSILLVRVDQSTVKAYHNVCPHRGTALGAGCGTFEEGRIICPFHGWRWDLTGRNLYVLERREFRDGQLRDSDVGLREVRVAVFAGFVFINLDHNAERFEDFIAPVRQWVEDLATGEMHHYWWKSLSLPANWKVAQEAFFETYHVPCTHPQLDKDGREVIYGSRTDADFTHRSVTYETLAHGHGRFYTRRTAMAGHVQQPVADPIDEMAARLMLIVDGLGAMVMKEDVEVLLSLRGKSIPEGSSLGAEYVRALYEQAARQQRPMPKPVPEVLAMWGGEIFIFPNLMILPQAGNSMIYRVRPDGSDPDRSIFEIFSTKTYPAAVKPPRPTIERVSDIYDPEQLLLIPRQDLVNVSRMQKGLHSRSMRQTWLAANQEKMILNMHQELDRYLRS